MYVNRTSGTPLFAVRILLTFGLSGGAGCKLTTPPPPTLAVRIGLTPIPFGVAGCKRAAPPPLTLRRSGSADD